MSSWPARSPLSLRRRIFWNSSGFIGSVFIKVVFIPFSLFECIDVVFKPEVYSGLVILTATVKTLFAVEIRFVHRLRLWNNILFDPFFLRFVLLIWLDFGLSPTASLTFDEAMLLDLFSNIVIHYHWDNLFHLKCVAINSWLNGLLLLSAFHDLLFNGTSGNDSIDSHRFCLADTMCAIGSLFVHRWVPIIVIEYYCICCY